MNMTIQQLSGLGAIPQTTPAAPTPREAPAETPAASTPLPRPEQVQQALEQIQRVVAPVAQNLQFSIDKGTGKTVVRVVDSETNEVVRQFPTEEILSIARALDRMQGLLINGKA
jgi:flagellar protein FlaG